MFVEEFADKVAQGLDAGLSGAEIARRLRVPHSRVSRAAARMGRPLRPACGSNFDWKRIREFYESGRTATECRTRFGISSGALDRAVTRGDIDPRPRPLQLPPGSRRQQVAALLSEGLGIGEIAARLNISKPTVCYHCRKLGIPPRTLFARRYDWEEISRVYEAGASRRECHRRFGFSNTAWNDAVERGDIVPRGRRIPIEELLVVGRPIGRRHLKWRLIDEGLKENRCEQCRLDEWRGEPLSPQLHHKNGDPLDNRIENLEFLCPNCHALTDTWGGRNGHRRPKREAA